MYVVLFLVLDSEYLFDNMSILKHMAGVVKWLRPRIVVPLCVGSNPTTRPIKCTMTFVIVYFIAK